MSSKIEDKIRLGVAYYPEHVPESEWQSDAKLMAELGLDSIRVGEFCWSRMQKSDGALTLDWLERLVSLFAEHGIDTVLCTPSATPPVWLVEKFPDLPFIAPDGRVAEFGGRRHYSPFHEGYRQKAAELAEALAVRFGSNKSVIGWQIDNEVGTYSTIDCSAPALSAFHRHIEEKYGSVEELNKRWGLIFWNQEVERFDQIPAPTEMMTTRSPQMILEYNRFSLNGAAEFVLLQAAAMRSYIGEHQFIMSNCGESVGHVLRRVQDERGQKLLDYAAVDNYPELHSLPGQAAMRLDRFRCMGGGQEFLAPELQIGSGYSATGGVLHEVRRYWAFETIVRGARLISWFHWRRFRSGCEWKLSSVVERDRRKRAAYDSMQSIIAEIRQAEKLLASAKVISDVQILYSQDNALARDRASEPEFWMQFQLSDGAANRFSIWEKEVLRAVYLPLTQHGVSVGFITEQDQWDPEKPLVVTDVDICTNDMAAKLQSYCEEGGTLICFPGAGSRDEDGCQLNECSPGRLSDLFGVTLQDYCQLSAGSGSVFDPATGTMTQAADTGPKMSIPVTMRGVKMEFSMQDAEVLGVLDAEAVGSYVGSVFDGQVAISERKVGKGRAIYMGCVPRTDADAAKLYALLLPGALSLPTRYRTVKLATSEGACTCLLNAGDEPCHIGKRVYDELTNESIHEIGAHGVVIYKEKEIKCTT